MNRYFYDFMSVTGREAREKRGVLGFCTWFTFCGIGCGLVLFTFGGCLC